MLSMFRPILRVAVPSPVRSCFDYWAPEECSKDTALRGARARVPFRKTTRIGIILDILEQSPVPLKRLRTATKILDSEPCLPRDLLELLQWATDYYHHPVGEVMFGALPALLRLGRSARLPTLYHWQLTETGHAVPPASLSTRAPRQAALMEQLHAHASGLADEDLPDHLAAAQQVLKALEKKGWVERIERIAPLQAPTDEAVIRVLETPQREAVDAICAAEGQYHTFLLDGVTGSGKTEVYLELIDRVVTKGRQALVLIPEIGLTPQMVARFRQRIRGAVEILHSGLTDQERLRTWLMARNGQAAVIIGTRSAVFVPLAHPGIFIVDEEHDLSYKQQDGFRYSARDVMVVRGRQRGVPVILGSATPSLESLHNARQGRYQHIVLPQRARGATVPAVTVIDVRARTFENSLSEPLMTAIDDCLAHGEQALLFVNRRGYAPLLICHACGRVADCTRCDAHLVYHRIGQVLRCHHCGSEQPMPPECPNCGSKDQRPLGTGTQRVTQALTKHFSKAHIARIDRDSATPKGALESALECVRGGQTDILVGTQMLTKGHHFPNVTLVGILDADGGLFGADFRSSERMAQLIVQVSGRAGRGTRPGRVLIQTHHPNHPLLQALLEQGYGQFAQAVLQERCEAGLPPHTSLALLRTETTDREAGVRFLSEASACAAPKTRDDVYLLGPVPAPMERRAGRYRAHLLIQAQHRRPLQMLLRTWLPQIESLRSSRRVRWSLDVDPQVLL